jgi:hypothetical protein
MQQRRGMNEFDRRGQLETLATLESECPSEQQYQHRPNSLATRADDVVGDLIDQRNI